MNAFILAAAAVTLVGVVAVKLSTRAGLPSLLVYLGIGLLIGEGGIGLRFDDAELTILLGTLALAVIIGEGGLTTKWQVVRPVAAMSGLLATVGVFITVGLTALISWLVLGVDARTAVLLGAVVGSTDAAATFAVMRTLSIRPRIRAALEAESGFNDPPVIILVTVVVSDAWFRANPWQIGGQVVYQLLVGMVVGLVIARLGGWLLARIALPSSGLYPLATWATMFIAYAVASTVHASGLMAIYVAGILLGNITLPHRQSTVAFAEGLAWLAQIGLFVLLGLLASPSRLPGAVLPALIVGGALTLVARPVAVALCTRLWRIGWREQVFLSVAGLRGAVPIVLATIPLAQGLPSAERIFDVVFLLVVVFTLIQGPLLSPVARFTGVAQTGLPRELSIESAPLERMDSVLMQVEVPEGSRLVGIHVDDLRLPPGVLVPLLHRDESVDVPDGATILRAGDLLMLSLPQSAQAATEARLEDLGQWGRLGAWQAGASSREAQAVATVDWSPCSSTT